MNWSRKVLICLVLCCAVLQNQAQQNWPKTLLWRITGKGLSQPSYLFGTMHLNDKRLFNFGDSVYNAIERTAGLAIEVSPDELCAYYVNQLFDELENTKKLDEILDEKDYKEFGPALSKKFDKRPDEITARDIVKEKNKWMQDLMEKGEMPTFVDAYLFNIARRQGKWLGGIEDMSDQAGLMEDLVDKSDIVYLLAGDSAVDSDNNMALDQMIDIYINQDLEKIEAGYNKPSAGKVKDLMLTRRNVKMARRIDSLVALRTMFLAIGAAHLPGDSGVIQLLQRRGFKVDPVFSSKKIAAKDYQFKEVQLPWVEVKDEQELYKVEMPANPASVKLMGMLEMKFLFDIFNMSGFCTIAVVNPGHALNKDTLMAQLTRRMFPGRQAAAPLSIIKDGVQGKEYIQKQDGSHIRLQVFAMDKVVYLAMLASVKKEAITSPDADKFFKSFTINKTPSATATMRRFTDSIMGVTVSTPAPLTYNKQFSIQNESYKITSYACTDAASGSYIMLFSREVTPGYYILNDSAVYEEFYTNLEGQYDNVRKKELYIQGHKAALAWGRNIKQPEVYAKALSVIRNNRNITLMIIGDSAHVLSSSVDDIVNSLRFTEPPKLKWNTYQLPDKSGSAWAPAAFRFHEEGSEMYMIAYDTTSSTTFFMSPDTLNKYNWADSDSTFWARAKGYQYSKGLEYEKKVQNGDLQGKEWLQKDGSVYTRIRVLVSGNILYKLFATSGKEYLQSENADKFFESFRLNGPVVAPNFLESKAKLLLSDLQSTDSATRFESYEALATAPFSKKELPLLHEALLQSYERPYDFSDIAVVNSGIGEKIAKLNDTSSLVFIEEQYKKTGKEKDAVKTAMLSTLARMKTEPGFALLARLVTLSTPDHMPDYFYSYALKDSLELSLQIYPQLQSLAKHEYYSSVVADIGLELMKKELVKKEFIAAAEKDFLQAAALMAEKLKSNDRPDHLHYRLAELLASFNTTPSNNMLQQFLPAKDNSFREAVLLHLLQNKQAVPAWAFDSIAADRNLRMSLYHKLQEIKKANLFPKKYLTQGYFAEAAMTIAAYDEEEPAAMDFVRLQKATFKGKSYNFYCYKIRYNSDDKSYTWLGIAGAFDSKGKKIEQPLYLNGIYYEEEFDKDRIREMLEMYLQQQEEE
jgi:uncharacterized protein YbaP (TraB family)